MKKLLENWDKFLKEELDHYEMEVTIKAEPETQIYGTIFNKIRAIEGVTILKTSERMRKDSEGNKYLQLNIKFMANPRMSQGEFMLAFKNKITSLKDDEGDRIISVNIEKIPQKLN